LERDRAVDNHCLGMGDPCPIVYPHRHGRRGQRVDATRAVRTAPSCRRSPGRQRRALWPVSTPQRSRNRPSGGRPRRGSLAPPCRWRGPRMPRSLRAVSPTQHAASVSTDAAIAVCFAPEDTHYGIHRLIR
jgi:hypothetical protein